MIEFKKATPDQIDVLQTISLETFRHSFYHLNTPENYELYVSKALTKDTLALELVQPTSEFYFGYSGHSIVCYFKINHKVNSHDEYDPTSIELQRIYVLPTYLAQGIGVQMIEFIKNYSRQAGYQSLWLGVWEHNLRAVQFYKRQGFIQVGVHQFMLGQEEQTDLLMECKL